MMGGMFGGAGFVMMFLFWAVVIAGAIWLLGSTFPRPSPDGRPSARGRSMGSSDSPREILKRRYASGEINREEYEQMKKDLGA